MRKALARVVVLIVLAALVVGGAWLWTRRPWRVVATVNGVSLTASELDLRAKALGGDLRETARTWIAKEVLLGEAVQRGVSVAEEDERATTDILASWFAAHGMTAERFFKEGPIPEQARRQDLKEGLLINALVKEGLRTASHLRRIFADVWDRSFHNRIDRWVMVTVHVSALHGLSLDRPRDRAELERFLRRIGEVLP